VTPLSEIPRTPDSSPLSSSSSEQFRQYLRQADKHIKEQLFDLAKAELAQARTIDPSNPYLVAFEERILLFEKGSPGSAVPSKNNLESSLEEVTDGNSSVKAEDLSNKEEFMASMRRAIEEEYRERFTKEVRRAEERAAKTVEEEQNKLEIQRQALNTKHQHQLEQIKEQYDNEYRAKVTEAVRQEEERLKTQFESQVRLLETDLKAQAEVSEGAKIQAMERKLTQEHENLLERERKSSQERERALKEQFEKQLQVELNKANISILKQSEQQQAEQNRLRREMESEFQFALEKERKNERQRYDSIKKELESSFFAEREKIKHEQKKKLDEELALLRKREQESYERKSIALRDELDREFRMKYEAKIAEEARLIREETEKTIDTEKKRLHEEYLLKLQQQESNFKDMRSAIKKETETQLLKRMEQISLEYDHKLELLGATIPESAGEKHQLYRNRVREYYLHGSPTTVENARKLMELKELLQLTFDEHLEIETDVRLELYVEDVKQLIKSRAVNVKDQNALDELKRKFTITAEESAKLEPYILSIVQRLAVKARILIADDELLLLQTLDDLLVDNGYQVFPALSVEQALDVLKSNEVDLILSDIKFEEDQLDGFQFFVAVQEQPHLRKIPFIFMSSLRDGVIIRSGVQLGADDYLTKPVDRDLLIAVIEGKLKRYRQI
jgi:CheY-like chemotaxis protein